MRSHSRIEGVCLVALAVVTLAGWMAASRLGRSRPDALPTPAGAGTNSGTPASAAAIPAPAPGAILARAVRDRAIETPSTRQGSAPVLPMAAPSGPGGAPAMPAQVRSPAPAQQPHPDPFDAFARWSRNAGAGAGAGASAGGRDAVNEGVGLARARRAALAGLIRTDPRAALARVVTWSERQRLPVAVQAELEEPVMARGRLEVLCAWNPPGVRRPGAASPADPWRRTFTTGDRVFQVFVYGRRLAQMTADPAVLHGVAVDDLLAVHEDPVRLLDPAEADAMAATGQVPAGAVCVLTGLPADGAGRVLAQHGDQILPLSAPALAEGLNRRLAAVEPGFRSSTEPPSFGQWSHGIKRVLFLRARFPDDLREPISEAEAAEVMRQANEYFVAASFNNVGLITTVGPLVTLPQPKLYYAVKGPGALLADARDATRAAGIESSVFDLDMVRFENVPGFDWGGLAAVGGRGLWLQSSGFGVVCHELGHNLGLGHANFWDTVRPALPEDTRNLPFDADSLVGQDSVIGPGDDVEYGDPFDIMGGGGGPEGHFHALHKVLLGWIPAAGVLTATNPGVYRIHAHDRGVLAGSRPHAVRVGKDVERAYSVSLRGIRADNPWLANGVELHWNNWHQAIGSGELLDTTPGSRHGKDDAPLVLGRTFIDAAAQVFITPLRRTVVQIEGIAVPACDVAVQFGPFPGNQPPELVLETSAVAAAPGQPVVLRAAGTDPDGDLLAVSWDLGEGQPGSTDFVVTNTWSTPGDHVVRCEVTDLRGGTASRHVVVRVGNVGTLRISGTVIDGSGRPLAGVRVHNGRYGTNSPYAPEYRWAYTDSDGRYTLAGLEPGEYEVGGFLAGYTTRPLNFTRPLILNQFTGVGVDFIAAALPRVSVTAVASGHEVGGRPAVFEVARTGPTNDTLRVFFRNTGTAAANEDYTAWASVEVQTNTIPTVLQPVVQTLTFGFVDLGPGVRATNLTFAVTGDTAAEGDETLVLTLHYPVTRTTITETETNTVDIPGWEVQPDNGRDAWFQTRPYYQLGARDEAVALIRDGTAPAGTTVSIAALERSTSENAGDTVSLVITRSGQAPAGTLRVPIVVSGSATPDDDYRALPDFVLIPAGVEAVRLSVEALDDRYVEGNENVNVRLGAGTGYRLGSTSATVLIVDNDLPLVSVSATDSIVTETGTGTGARVTFQRSGDPGLPLEVDYLIGGTALPGVDYVSLPGRVTLPAGAGTATVTVAPLDDPLFEGDETVEISIGDSPVYNAVSPSRATVIVRDDEYPSVTVEATDDEATEGADNPGVFVIRRTGALNLPLAVRYRFGGSAIHQADFVASGDRIVISAGQTEVLLTVTPIDDAIREDTETIAIELEPDPAYTLGVPSGAAVSLLDPGDSDLAVGFSLLTSRFPESRTDPEIAVRISGNPEDGAENVVTVTWEVLGGSATLGDDYLLTNGTLAFAYADPDGDTPLSNRMAFIPLTVVDDLLPESDETLVVRLRIAPTTIPSDDTNQPPQVFTNGILDVYAVHTFTIVDDDRSDVRIRAVNATTVEGSAVPAHFVLERFGQTNTAQPVGVHLSGLATPGSDYVAIPGVLTLAPGQLSMEVPVVPIDDPVMEYRENVILTLVNAPGSRVSSASRAEVFIDDNDGTLEFTLARLSVGEEEGVARIGIRRRGDASLAATAWFEALPLTARPLFLTNGLPAGDFVPTNLPVSFAPGDTLRDVEVLLLDNEVPDGPRTVRLGLSRGSSLFPLGGQNTAILTILDNDSLLSTGTNNVVAIETDAFLDVILVRSGPADRTLVAEYRTADISAVAGEDYAAVSGTVTFLAGETTARVQVPLFNDFTIEGDESFVVLLTTPEGGPVGEVIAAIVDDDCAVGFEVATAGVDEDAGTLEVTVVRSGSTLKPVTVDFTAVSGTATEGADFMPATGSLTFAGNRFEALTNGTGEVVFLTGETNQTLSVRILNDSDGERDEQFEVVLSNPRAGHPGLTVPFVTAGSITGLVVTLHDNEAPGRVDDGFQPGLGADAPVRALGLQADGKVLVGGDFTSFDGVVLSRLVRLHADGFVDRSFNPGRGFNAGVLAVMEVSDGRVLAGGAFTNVDGADRPYLARLEPDGTRAAGFDLRPNGIVRALAAGATGTVFVAGDFTGIGSEPRRGVARLTSAGQLDGGFQPGSAEPRSVRALLATEVNGVWAGGLFNNWAGTGSRNLVRLLPDGSPDPAVPASALAPDGPVNSLVRAPDGSVYVGGGFTAIGGLPRAGMARLSGGRVDPGFDPGTAVGAGAVATAPVLAGGIQGGDRILVAGLFEQFADVAVGRFVRLESSGDMDRTFFRGTGANDAIRAVAVQPDGAFLIGGDFTEVNERPRLRIARIHADEKFAEGFVEFSAPVVSAAETDPDVEVTVRRTGSAKAPARVEFRTFDGTARAGEDYDALGGELNFAAGEIQQSFRIRLRDDLLAEGSETVTLVLTNASGAFAGRQSVATLVITDDEAAVAFDLPSMTVDETADELVVLVRRSGSLAEAAAVGFRTEGGTASMDVDFTAGAGVVSFPPGTATGTVRVAIRDDDLIEGDESFRVVLEAPTGGLAVGSQGIVTVTLLDDDRPPTHYNLTVEPSPGGIVTPGGGRFPTNLVVSLQALPGNGFEFARWEGTIASADNPLSLLMDRNHVLTARFRPRDYLETFESGGFGALPWQTAVGTGWVVTRETASGGQFSARSGSVTNSAASVLLLERETPAGGGSFDFRTASEAGWDFLEFRVNGVLFERWSGIQGWQTYAFNLPAGRNQLEWRFQRDRTFGGALDAVWIDNLDLPDDAPPPVAPRIAWAGGSGAAGCAVRVEAIAGRLYLLEKSTDLRAWTPVTGAVSAGATLLLADPECGAGSGGGARFYRVRAE